MRAVVRNLGRVAVRVEAEEVKLKLRAKVDHNAFLRGFGNRGFQKVSRVQRKHGAVRAADFRKQPYHAPMAGPPGQRRKRFRVGEEQQVGMRFVSEPADGRGVDGYAVRKRTRQLLRHDRDILRQPEDVAKSEADELDVLRGGVFYDFLSGIHLSWLPFLHILSC
ncbi:hypothetical protein SDC9_159848 [bioreactor metagenome]|uniref:Uncharacterized protein n=1 Tax=bioreactor metagenome TaxID=1076179 RepID=A0A645FEZ7_9ZZZZ